MKSDIRIHRLETRNRKSEIRNQKSEVEISENAKFKIEKSEFRNATCNIQFRYSLFISVCDINISKMNRKTLKNFPAGGGYKYAFTSGDNF